MREEIRLPDEAQLEMERGGHHVTITARLEDGEFGAMIVRLALVANGVEHKAAIWVGGHNPA